MTSTPVLRDHDRIKYPPIHHCTMKKAIALFLILLLLAPYAAADGMMFIEDRDMWYLQPEENQLAAIHYENGMENLLISVSPGGNFSGDHAVWIFPVPAAPGKVKIDVLKGYPRMYGKNFEDSYVSAVTTSVVAQILYATFPVSILSGGSAVILSAYVFGMAGSISKSADVEIYDRAERMGITTEVVTATDADALQEYLVSLGMDGKNDEREFLQSYIGKNYSFVVSYISDVKKFREAAKGTVVYDPYTGSTHANQLGVFARFPTDRIYFPLRPTAVYGSRQVPVLLYVTGFVSPALYDSIRKDSEVTYFTQGYFTTGDLSPFFNGRTTVEPLEYTKIKISAPSDRFTEDLWIDPSPPASMVFRQMYLQIYALVSVAFYVLFSMIASLVAGMLVFKKRTVDTKTLLLHGLWNCATFIGLALATKNKFPQKEYGKRGPYILAFYLIFAGLLSVYAVALSPSLAMAVLIGWVAGLLSPLLALAMLFIPLMFLSQMHYMDATSIVFVSLASLIVVVLALSPVPVLLWLKRWPDPEPVQEPDPDQDW